ncbi:glycoside hydrolase family 16 protein [Zunongwangia endophytica]|uniref:Glycoside hydrolase family 16 protein n=1 Tax=Zunongwangia endophytica TaxID=1808945 RepID=A0ABV8HDQ3_9FLAO|nr:glycoside hydrolase family 16 protein [Zunongwangia endophytica]MDN3596724.1 glycoside hydrolase family 16 protein [Zunongwangia endophytica]
MNKFFLFFLLSTFSHCFSQKSTDTLFDYKLVWSDEFDKGNKPDSEFWSYEKGFVRNEELQWYQDDNASIHDGLLVIEARKERIKNSQYKPKSEKWYERREFANYTSASVNTKDKFSFKYGILEVKAKIDTALGMWPAIWTLGIEKGWPYNGEIDVTEYYLVDQKPAILANAAWKGKTDYVAWDSEKIPFSKFLEKDPKWADSFHIWRMHWAKEVIKIYLDEELLNTIDLSKTENPDGFNPFHQPHYILLNLAIGSNGGDPSATLFPKKYEIDYVRVYQKKITNYENNQASISTSNATFFKSVLCSGFKPARA